MSLFDFVKQTFSNLPDVTNNCFLKVTVANTRVAFFVFLGLLTKQICLILLHQNKMKQFKDISSFVTASFYSVVVPTLIVFFGGEINIIEMRIVLLLVRVRESAFSHDGTT